MISQAEGGTPCQQGPDMTRLAVPRRFSFRGIEANRRKPKNLLAGEKKQPTYSVSLLSEKSPKVTVLGLKSTLGPSLERGEGRRILKDILPYLSYTGIVGEC